MSKLKTRLSKVLFGLLALVTLIASCKNTLKEPKETGSFEKIFEELQYVEISEKYDKCELYYRMAYERVSEMRADSLLGQESVNFKSAKINLSKLGNACKLAKFQLDSFVSKNY